MTCRKNYKNLACRRTLLQQENTEFHFLVTAQRRVVLSSTDGTINAMPTPSLARGYLKRPTSSEGLLHASVKKGTFCSLQLAACPASLRVTSSG